MRRAGDNQRESESASSTHEKPASNAASEKPPARIEGEPSGPPRVWVILSDKHGDNAQALRVAAALGWDFERKFVQMKEPFVLGKPRVRPSLDHIDGDRSDALEPPWPDLIITIGRRPSSVALWVRHQSGGHAKIVLIGKTSGPIERFDLVIASGESSFPPLSNVVDVTLPLMSIDTEAIAAAGEAWRPRLAALPRPLIAMLVGGATGPFVYNRAVVERLIRTATEVMADTGGSVYITTSRRTPQSAVAALEDGLPAGARIFTWAPEVADNPFKGLLALADGFIVTGDSISMMVEVILCRKPLVIFPVPVSFIGSLDRWRRAFIRKLYAKSDGGWIDRLRRPVAGLFYRLRLANPTRDFAAFHQLLIDRGWAVPMGQGFPQPRREIPDDLSRVVASIKALYGPS